PWQHGGWSRSNGEALGPVHFNAKTAVDYREKMELPFFEFYLKGEGQLGHPKAWVFETGTNQWRKHDAWPPKEAQPKSLYLHAGGNLAFVPSAASERGTYDEYVSDPAKPVPYLDKVTIGMAAEYMVADQRFAAQRPDVLVYA